MSRRVIRPAGPPAHTPQRMEVPKPCPPKQVPSQARLLPRAVVFVGPMAVGKTSVGKRVAKKLGIPFIDTDARIAQAYGAITEFFATRGEAEFRRVEAEVVAREVTEPGARIVSLGGGAVLSEDTRRLLANYPVVLLMSTEAAVLKTANLARRPLLRDDPHAWTRILEQRRPLYNEVADVTFHTNRHSKDQVTRRVAAWIESLGSASRSTPESSGRDGTSAQNPQAKDHEHQTRTRARRRRRGRRRRKRADGSTRTP